MSKQYLVNSDTKEIHDLNAQDSRCNIPTAREDDSNLKRICVKEFMLLIREGFDTCGWCFADESDLESV